MGKNTKFRWNRIPPKKLLIFFDLEKTIKERCNIMFWPGAYNYCVRYVDEMAEIERALASRKNREYDFFLDDFL